MASDKVHEVVAEMAMQAANGHKRFCVGYHEHGELGFEAEWEDWSVTFTRLVAAVEQDVKARCEAAVLLAEETGTPYIQTALVEAIRGA